MSNSINVNDFVPFNWVMDPKTDDMLPNGERVENGMKVLIGGSLIHRTRISDTMDGYELQRALENQRWCTVSELSYTGYGENRLVKFIGIYEDGTKMSRTYNVSYAWYVKTAKPSVRAVVLEYSDGTRTRFTYDEMVDEVARIFTGFLGEI